MLGISRGTVSLALSDSPLIKESTKERIKQLAREVNYLPSDIGRSLVTGRTYTIGVLIPRFSVTFYTEIADEIQTGLMEKGYSGIILNVTTGEMMEKAMEMLIRKKVDGIISFAHIDSYESRINPKETGMFIIENSISENGDYVVCNKYAGAISMMEHLIMLGHRKIGFICYEDKNDERFMAYKDSLLRHGLLFKDEWAVHGSGFHEEGYRNMQRILSLPDKPEAVFAMNDLAAIGGIRAIKEAGLNIPGDIAIVGFDNIKEGEYMPVSLTTVDQKKKELARKSVEALLHKIENPEDMENYHMVIEPELIIRESCGYHLRERKSVQNNGGAKCTE